MAIPVLFVSHGSPMTTLEKGPWQSALAAFGQSCRPEAIVAISAHWDTGRAVEVTSVERNTVIHDFGGFPQELHQLDYPAPGSPSVAAKIGSLFAPARVSMNNRGLDHGVWGPLRLMYPDARIPVVALSLPSSLSAEDLFAMGQKLAPLRSQGVLLMGSGGIVHNLRRVRFGDPHHAVEPWAAEFDRWFGTSLVDGDYDAILNFREAAPHGALAVPTLEHFAPVWPVLGAAPQPARVEVVYEGFEYGTLSMRTFALSEAA